MEPRQFLGNPIGQALNLVVGRQDVPGVGFHFEMIDALIGIREGHKELADFFLRGADVAKLLPVDRNVKVNSPLTSAGRIQPCGHRRRQVFEEFIIVI